MILGPTMKDALRRARRVPGRRAPLPRTAIAHAIYAAVAAERAATVAWLREADSDDYSAEEHADWVERGDHRTDLTPKEPR